MEGLNSGVSTCVEGWPSCRGGDAVGMAKPSLAIPPAGEFWSAAYGIPLKTSPPAAWATKRWWPTRGAVAGW